MFGMNGYKMLKCFRKEKHDFRRGVLSSDRSYIFFQLVNCQILYTVLQLLTRTVDC